MSDFAKALRDARSDVATADNDYYASINTGTMTEYLDTMDAEYAQAVVEREVLAEVLASYLHEPGEEESVVFWPNRPYGVLKRRWLRLAAKSAANWIAANKDTSNE